MSATRESFGTVSLSISRRLPANSAAKLVKPVMLPPGRARLLTNPAATGSTASCIKTTGIVLVAFLAAMVAGVAIVSSTSTLRRTSSSARAGSRSSLLSAERYSKAMFLPSTNPSSESLRRKISPSLEPRSVVPLSSQPTLKVFACCCAWAIAAQPSTELTSTIQTIRFITSPRLKTSTIQNRKFAPLMDAGVRQVVVQISDIQPHHMRRHAILADVHRISIRHRREIGQTFFFIHPALDSAAHIFHPFANERSLLVQISLVAHRAMTRDKGLLAQRPQRFECFQPKLRVTLLNPGLDFAEDIVAGEDHAFFLDNDGGLIGCMAWHVNHAEGVVAHMQAHFILKRDHRHIGLV